MKKGICSIFIAVFIFSLFLLPNDSSTTALANDDSNIKIRIADRNELEPHREKLSTSLLVLIDDTFLLPDESKADLLKEMEDDGQISDISVNNLFYNSTKTSVYVYIQLVDDESLSAIDSYIIEVDNYDERAGLIAAWVDIDSIEKLAKKDEVKYIREIIAPVVNSGAKLSEGDSVLKADQTRTNYSIDGSGIKIGVISDGANSYASAIASGDLPSDVTILSDTVGGDEGTAMMEIIHDLAPGADLYFHDCGINRIAFNSAISDLVAAGCDIIVDDIGWIAEPFFEDGIIAEHISDIISENDILYVTSAGNYAEQHYQGNFDDYSGTLQYYDAEGVLQSVAATLHDFSNGTDASNKSLYVNIPNGSTVMIVLQWDDPSGAVTSDYDLYLEDGTSIIDSSEYITNPFGDPIEYIKYTNNTGSLINGEITVQKFAGNSSDILEVYIYGGSVLDKNIVSADSIYGHAAVPEVISCGAVPQDNPNLIEYFSSRGPVTMISETRNKPDICAVDGVSVTGVGFTTPFYGTSASAPHVAAVAALIMDRHPTAEAEEIKDMLIDNTTDLGVTGYDWIYGNGLIDTLAIADAYSNVKFNSNGGSMVSTVVIENGQPVSKPSNPIRSGYDFDGWYADAGLSTPYNFSTPVTNDMTLYADWEKITYFTVDFDTNGGDTVASLKNVSYSSKISAPDEPEKGGYIFKGWYKDSSLKNAWNFSTDTVTSNTTLYAKWEEWDNPFSDVSKSDWFYDSAAYCRVNGIIYGTSATTFSPDVPTSRAMIVTILWRMEGEPSAAASSFRDLDADWYRTAVNWAAQEGIVYGYSKYTFGPTDEITREQFTAILSRYADYKGYDINASASLSEFKDDTDVSNWAIKTTKWAVAEGYLLIFNEKLEPLDYATRDQVAVVLHKFLKNDKYK